jgi:hypothetical protein
LIAAAWWLVSSSNHIKQAQHATLLMKLAANLPWQQWGLRGGLSGLMG